jgi:hypothetical protein
VRGLGEVVVWRAAKLLSFGLKLHEGLTLGDETGDPLALALLLFDAQVADQSRWRFPLQSTLQGKELVGLEAILVWAPNTLSVVEGGLEDRRRVKAAKETHCGVNGEGAAIVVGMAAFIGVGQDRLGLKGIDLASDTAGESDEMEDACLVRDGVAGRSRCFVGRRWEDDLTGGLRGKPCEAERLRQLLSPSFGVGLEREETMCAGICTVFGSAIGDAKEAGVAEPIESPTESQNFVVRVGQDDQEAGKAAA